MKKILSLFLVVLTLFSLSIFTACNDEPTDEDIALGYLAEIKGYTYEEGVENANGWTFDYYYYDFSANSGGTLTISADGTCTVDINSTLQGTFKIGDFIYKEGGGCFFEMLENTTSFNEFYIGQTIDATLKFITLSK
jgi:hypothetical protein